MTKKDKKTSRNDRIIKFDMTTDETTAAMLLAAQEAGKPIKIKLDEQAARQLFSDDAIDTLGKILDADPDDFLELCRVARLNKARSFIGADLKDIEFGCSLEGFDLTRANLSGANFYWHNRFILSHFLQGCGYNRRSYDASAVQRDQKKRRYR